MSALQMGITTEGSTRVGQIAGGLRFRVAYVAVGTGGYNPGTPAQELPLVPAATALTAEVLRKPVPSNQTVVNAYALPRGQETTYTTFSGTEVTGALGEAGLFAVVDDPGGSGLTLGYVFLLAQAHFPRIILEPTDKLALRWPIRYGP